MGLALRDTACHTYGDYLTWPEDARYELIDGFAYLMAPAPTPRHQDIAGAIFVQLYNKLGDSPCRVLIAPVDVVLPQADETDEQANTVVQPDVLVVCDPGKIGEKRVRGAPDMVVEVLSPSTAGHDMVLKRRIYEQAGVREYWLIHPTDRVLTVYRLEDREFGKPDVQELKGETNVAVLPGVTIQWDTLVARLPAID
ncbi:MAG: Uma2 family endonuclease [Sulfurimicrobium sp.]|nr:Uma2 family endonuclease [Sulfurimicrobium sp.]